MFSTYLFVSGHRKAAPRRQVDIALSVFRDRINGSWAVCQVAEITSDPATEQDLKTNFPPHVFNIADDLKAPAYRSKPDRYKVKLDGFHFILDKYQEELHQYQEILNILVHTLDKINILDPWIKCHLSNAT